MSADSFDTSVVTSQAGLEELAVDWSRLHAAGKNPLLSHAWFAAAAAAFHRDDVLQVIAVRNGGRLVAVAPMVLVGRRLTARLEVIGSRALHEPAGLLADDAAALDELCRQLVAFGRPMALSRMEPGSGVLERLRPQCRGRGLVFVAASAPVLRVDIGEEWTAYAAARSPEFRAGFPRKRRQLQDNGPVIFQTMRPGTSDVGAALEEAFAVEAAGWKGAGGSAVSKNPRLLQFLAEIASRFAEAGALRVYFLRAGDRAVAMIVAVECAGRLWELKIGYRSAFGHGSPGMVLLWETLRDAFDRGLRAYEFLGSGDGQQQSWATASRPLHTLVYYPYRPAGAWALGLDVAAHIAGRIRAVKSR